MELREAVKGRRSIRAYKPQNVSEKVVEKLIEAASYAPSAGDIEPWRFVVARKPDIKRELAQAAGQTFIEEAPVVIVVCTNEKRAEIGYGFKGKTLYCVQDTAAATQNILLTAYSLGLGTCWIGAFNGDQAKRAVDAPEGMRPVAIIPVGYADEVPPPRNRRPLSQIMHRERFLK